MKETFSLSDLVLNLAGTGGVGRLSALDCPGARVICSVLDAGSRLSWFTPGDKEFICGSKTPRESLNASLGL